MDKRSVRIPWATSAVGRRVAVLSGVGVLTATLGGMLLMSQVLPRFGVTSPPEERWFVIGFSVIVGILLAALSGIFVYGILRLRVVRRLDSVIRAFRNVEEGDLLRRMETPGDDEFTDVARAFNGLMDRVVELTASALRSDLMVTWAQRELRLKEEVLAKSNQLADLNAQLVQRVQVASTLLEVADAVSGGPNLDAILKAVGGTLVRSMNLVDFRLLVPGDDASRLVLRHAEGLLPGVPSVALDGPLAACLASGHPLSIPDLRNQETASPVVLHAGAVTGSLVAVPFMTRKAPGGVIVAVRAATNAFGEPDIDFLQLVAGYVGLAVTNSLLHRETLKLANEDQLTGLLNRRRFMELFQGAWDQSTESGEALAVLMIDVDWFKKFNDVHGHLVGDEVLRRIATAIRSQLRPRDVAGRFGGEEFIIAAPGTTRDMGCMLGERIRMAVDEARFDGGEGTAPPLRLTVSVGVSMRDPRMLSPADVVREADRCLYLAKARGRNQVHPSLQGGSGLTPIPRRPPRPVPED